MLARAIVWACLASALDGQGRAMLDPIREQALHPAELIARLHLPPNAAIVDVGAGPGFFTVPLARAVPRGSVLATDLKREYLDVAADRAQKAGLTNVRTRVVDALEPGLEPHSADLVLLCQVDHYLKDRTRYFGALAAALRPHGRIALVNYQRHREADLAAARAAGLHVIEEWAPSPPFFLLVLAP